MPAGKLNLDIEQGATYRKTLIWKDGSNTPINLVGFTARMRINGISQAIDMTTENGRISLQAGGVIQLYLSAADTQALVFTSGAYDLKLINGTDEVRLIEGYVYVSPTVTPRGT